MLKRNLSVLAFSFVSALSAQAAGNMRAGLWEFTTQSGIMQNMPKMSPEQIEQLRKMGIDMTQLQTGAIVSKICVTKEMAEHDELPQMNHKEVGCETKNQKRNANGYTMDIICDGPMMKGQGVLKTVFASDKSFSSSSDFNGLVQGVPVQDHADTSGKWLNANCGSVQPILDDRAGKQK